MYVCVYGGRYLTTILAVCVCMQGIDIVKSEPIRKFYSGLAKVDSPFHGMRGLKPSPPPSSPSPQAAAFPSALSQGRGQKSYRG